VYCGGNTLTDERQSSYTTKDILNSNDMSTAVTILTVAAANYHHCKLSPLPASRYVVPVYACTPYFLFCLPYCVCRVKRVLRVVRVVPPSKAAHRGQPKIYSTGMYCFQGALTFSHTFLLERPGSEKTSPTFWLAEGSRVSALSNSYRCAVVTLLRRFAKLSLILHITAFRAGTSPSGVPSIHCCIQ
jgi:hypothetical protein